MQKLIKIGINGRPFAQKSMRGIARHTLELIKEIHLQDPSLEITIYTYGNIDLSYKESLPNVKWRETIIKPKILWDLIILPRQIKKDGIQLFHSTNNLGIPWTTSLKKILTLHDTLTHRHRMTWAYNNIWGKLNYLLEFLLLKKADAFITISEAAKLDIIKTMDIPEEKLQVIYNGAHVLRPLKKAVREEFYLYVGGLEERKNIVFMISALEEAQDLIQHKIKLVLVSRLTSATRDVLQAIENSQLDITIRENISDDELGELYQKARGLINPSLFEGFGLPIIEAMLAETPVIVSKLEVFYEITSQLAYFFDPLVKAQLVNLIVKIEKKELPLDQFVVQGKKSAEKFLWSNMAKETIALYRKVLN